MHQNGLILWEKRDLKRIIWLAVVLAVLVGVVGFQFYRNRKWQEQFDKNSYTYWEGVIIRVLNNPYSLSLADYQEAKRFGVLDRLIQEHPNYKPKIARLIQIVEGRQQGSKVIKKEEAPGIKSAKPTKEKTKGKIKEKPKTKKTTKKKKKK